MSTEPKELPKQELLIKLLGMTTSTNDPEALSALRKANALLRTAGWDWEKLVRGRITVIADPFTELPSTAHNGRDAAPHAGRPAAPPPMTPRTPPRPAAPPPQPAPPLLRGTPSHPLSTRENAFAGHCHCCGLEVVAKAGTIFQSHNSTSWKIACATCNTSAHVTQYPATHVRHKRGKKSISDLA